jgi:hypothetical protein
MRSLFTTYDPANTIPLHVGDSDVGPVDADGVVGAAVDELHATDSAQETMRRNRDEKRFTSDASAAILLQDGDAQSGDRRRGELSVPAATTAPATATDLRTD